MAKILIVDDSASIRQMVSFTLRGKNHIIVEAQNGIDALNKITSDVKMVITDINMPKMDGITLIKKLRDMQSYKFIPILILTTESQIEKKKEGKSAGATGWIIKPFNVDQLLAVVNKFV